MVVSTSTFLSRCCVETGKTIKNELRRLYILVLHFIFKNIIFLEKSLFDFINQSGISLLGNVDLIDNKKK